MLSLWPENHFGVVYLKEIMKIWRWSKWTKLFKFHATGNTAQLNFCRRYELSHVPPTPLRYWFDLGTWEPLWSDITSEDGTKNSSDFCPSWSFSKFMLRTTLFSWASVEVIAYVESPQHLYAIGLTWEPHWSRMPREKINLQVWEEFWSLEKEMKVQKECKSVKKSQ